MALPTIRVAAVQAAPVFLDLEATLGLLEEWTRRAASEGAKVIAFPETWLPGYRPSCQYLRSTRGARTD